MSLYDTVIRLRSCKSQLKKGIKAGDLSVTEEKYFSQVIANCHEIANMTKCCDSPDWQVDLFDEICCGNCGILLKNIRG